MSTISTVEPSFKIPKIYLWLSGLVCIMVCFTSLYGIFSPNTYRLETHNWALQAVGQDYANLFTVIILAISTYFLSRDSLRAFLVWIGTYLYFLYAYVIYAFNLHFNFLFLVYVAILGFSFYILVGSLMSSNPLQLSEKLKSNPVAKSAALLLSAIGILFTLLWLSEIVPNLLAGTIPSSLIETGLWVNPVHVLDLGLLLPGMLLTAGFILKNKAIGYFWAVPLLIFSVTMGIGIVTLMLLSYLNGLAYSLPAVIVVTLIILSSVWQSILFLRKMPK